MYGKKIQSAREYISLTNQKIIEANQTAEDETRQWQGSSQGETAFKMYDLMLNEEGKSGLKAIVAQCLASILRWKASLIPDEFTQEKMFDIDLYGLKTDEQKKAELKAMIEEDQYLKYIVNAIKYAAGENV